MEYAVIIIIIIGLFAMTVACLVHAVLLLLTAEWIAIPDGSFRKAFVSTMAGLLASIPVSFFMGFFPIFGWSASLMACLVIPALITQGIFRTTFLKALSAEALRLAIESIVVAVILFFLITIIGLEALRLGAGEWAQGFFQELSGSCF
ncbi:hypothetical protein JXA80_06555 [bacterium]|nr:hypothetical protein [candidate division CSSED10-310 bacterium]